MTAMAQFFHDLGHPTTQRLRCGRPEDVPAADSHHDLVENSRSAPTPQASESQPAFQSAVGGFDAGADLVVLLERVGCLLPPSSGKATLLGGVVKRDERGGSLHFRVRRARNVCSSARGRAECQEPCSWDLAGRDPFVLGPRPRPMDDRAGRCHVMAPIDRDCDECAFTVRVTCGLRVRKRFPV